jgi:hypothetical protein
VTLSPTEWSRVQEEDLPNESKTFGENDDLLVSISRLAINVFCAIRCSKETRQPFSFDGYSPIARFSIDVPVKTLTNLRVRSSLGAIKTFHGAHLAQLCNHADQ